MRLRVAALESDIQKAAVAYVRAHGYGKYLIMIPNGVPLAGGVTTRAKLMNHYKAMGLRVGAYDLFLALPRRGYHGAWFELKRGKDGRVSDAQRKFGELMGGAGYYATYCATLEGFVYELDWYLAT